MAKTDFKSVDDYIAAQPKNVQVALRRVRSIVHKAVPNAVEVISYQMPTFKVTEGAFCAWEGGRSTTRSIRRATRW